MKKPKLTVEEWTKVIVIVYLVTAALLIGGMILGFLAGGVAYVWEWAIKQF